jgi:hypothetical protein
MYSRRHVLKAHSVPDFGQHQRLKRVTKARMITRTGKLRHEDGEFKACLDYTVTTYFTKIESRRISVTRRSQSYERAIVIQIDK